MSTSLAAWRAVGWPLLRGYRCAALGAVLAGCTKILVNSPLGARSARPDSVANDPPVTPTRADALCYGIAVGREGFDWSGIADLGCNRMPVGATATVQPDRSNDRGTDCVGKLAEATR